MPYSAALLADSLGGALKPEARLKVTVLGGFHAEFEPGRALVLPTKKAQALLAYLALPPKWSGGIERQLRGYWRSPGRWAWSRA
jgi:hypothetical protein